MLTRLAHVAQIVQEYARGAEEQTRDLRGLLGGVGQRVQQVYGATQLHPAAKRVRLDDPARKRDFVPLRALGRPTRCAQALLSSGGACLARELPRGFRIARLELQGGEDGSFLLIDGTPPPSPRGGRPRASKRARGEAAPQVHLELGALNACVRVAQVAPRHTAPVRQDILSLHTRVE